MFVALESKTYYCIRKKYPILYHDTPTYRDMCIVRSYLGGLAGVKWIEAGC